MKMHLEKPIGMQNFLNELKQMEKKKEAYRRFGVPLPSFCISLDAGDGRTELIKYYAKFLRYYEMCEFSGREPFLEFVFDGSMEQMRKVFKNIRDEEGTKNNFQGVLAIDAMKLAEHLGEEIVSDFMDTICRVSQYASVIFFCPRECNRNEKRFIELIYDTISKMKTVYIPPYTKDDLVRIMINQLEEHGVEMEAEICDAMYDWVQKLYTAKDAADFAVNLIPYANYSYFIPRLEKEMFDGLEMNIYE